MNHRRALLLLALVLTLAPAARAQDDAPAEGYRRLPGDGFVLERMDMDEGLARAAVALFSDCRAAVEKRLGQPMGTPPRLILAPTDDEYARRREALAGSRPGEGELACAIPGRRAVLIRVSRLAGGNEALGPTLRHELAHLVLAGVAKRGGGPLPRWLEEGLAEYAAGVVPSREDELEIGGGARFGTLERFDQLETSFPPHAEAAARTYRMCLTFVIWLDGRAKPDGVRSVVAELAAGYAPDGAVRRTTGLSAHEAEFEWKSELASRHSVGEALLRSSGFWWGLVSLLAVAAFVRQAIVSRRLKRKLGAEETE